MTRHSRPIQVNDKICVPNRERSEKIRDTQSRLRQIKILTQRRSKGNFVLDKAAKLKPNQRNNQIAEEFKHIVHDDFKKKKRISLTTSGQLT